MSTPKIVTALVCDDVRIEKNNKNILIGVYPDDIVVPNVPMTIRLTLWIRVTNLDPNQLDYELRGFLGKKKKFEGGFQIGKPSESGSATIVLGPFPLKIDQVGDFKFDIRIPGGTWKTAIKLPVKVQPSTA